MSKHLKAGLLFASALLLVACGTNEDYSDTQVSEEPESTEVVDTNQDDQTQETESPYTLLHTEGEDGSTGYTLQGELDDHGWAVVHTVLVDADGNITESDFNYVNDEGKLKTDDEEYVSQMSEVSGNDITETIDYLNNYLVENQNIDGLDDDSVDVVSGATSTYTTFTETAKELLEQINAD